mgnify:CR=1 FL=1
MPSALEAVKRAAVEAVDAKKPVLVLFGTVISDSPLKIQVEQKLTLGEKQLVLCRDVTDYKVEMTVDHFTEITDNHRHPYKGRKKFLVHNKLKAGEQVVLLRIQGGKKFLVVDRLPEGG